ncbi:hypothetical protein GCM10011506_35050 [Marivirga lumbricoides]|uniref:Tetratricopeptide repeat protein n=1 Tax=Marivirga lumbricoides TaxID=1046115 RepID=A0ABQ1MTS5_9BACT|nr:hypothetical protein GCM10011506_35050 [Marivirga lumbricoides]
MSDWDKLGISPINDKEYIFKALKESVHELNFEDDLPQAFQYLKTYHSLIKKVERTTAELNKLAEGKAENEDNVILYLDSDRIYDTPTALIARFKEVYENPAIRFNKLVWKSAIANAVQHSTQSLSFYCMPIIKFLSSHYILKSDVLTELIKAFPFHEEFMSSAWREVTLLKYPELGAVEVLLTSGHSEIEIYIEVLKDAPLTLAEKDIVIRYLIEADEHVKKRTYQQAFKSLATRIPDNKRVPVVWHKMVNIAFMAAYRYHQENAKEIFFNTLNYALEFYPEDAHLLYMKVLGGYEEAQDYQIVKSSIIEAIKICPSYQKLYYLLGKTYLQLKQYSQALDVFRTLQKMDALNGEYIVYTAVSFRHFITNQLQDGSIKKDKTYYLNIIHQMIDQHLFEEINELQLETTTDNDIQALLIFSTAYEQYILTGQKDFTALEQVLTLTEDAKIIFRAFENYLENMLTWEEIASREGMIRRFYNGFPESDVATYHMGKYFHAIHDFKMAYDYYLKALEINPDNLDVYFSISQACESLKYYDLAVKYIAVYMQYSRYHISPVKIMAFCSFQVEEYYQSYTNYKWLFSLVNPSEITTNQLLFCVSALYNYIKFDKAIEGDSHYKRTFVKDELENFESYKKPDGFYEDAEGHDTLYWLAMLCKHVELDEEGLEYVRQIETLGSLPAEWIIKDITEYKLHCMRSLGLHQELIDWLEDDVEEEIQTEINDTELALKSFYIAFAYEGLDNIEKEFEWKLKTAFYYASMDDAESKEAHRLEWLESFTVNIVNRFESIFEREKTIEAGKAYFKIQKEPHFRHAMVAHYMAVAYEALNDKENSLKYHQICVDYNQLFPGYFEDLAEISQLIIEN